jgi:hypothetical protein
LATSQFTLQEVRALSSLALETQNELLLRSSLIVLNSTIGDLKMRTKTLKAKKSGQKMPYGQKKPGIDAMMG